MKTISWDQLKDWLDFTDDEPLGEERDDLRIGALASVMLNMNIDTKKIGGVLEPKDYISGWGEDRTYIMTLKPPKIETEDVPPDPSVNNPVVWENFTTNLRRMMSQSQKG